MNRKVEGVSLLTVVLMVLHLLCTGAGTPVWALSEREAKELVRSAIKYWRDESSFTNGAMTVHRPDWEREMEFDAWTLGTARSIVRFKSPPKDAGNSSLTIDEETWSYNPKINKVIKIPASMMHQSWMGSDFSYSDLSKDPSVIDEYTHKLLSEESQDGHKVYVVESIPLPASAIVWGKEIFKIRDDYVLLERQFFDQEMRPIKHLVASDFKRSGEKVYAAKVRMTNLEKPEEWTQVIHSNTVFGIPVKESLFSVSSLSNPKS